MSKTELLHPIAKYYIVDSQSGYKQNVSLEQNCIQNVEKMFSRGEPDVLCPASGAGEGYSPLAPLSAPSPALQCEQPAGWFSGVACVSQLDSWVILLPRAGTWLAWPLPPAAVTSLTAAEPSV